MDTRDKRGSAINLGLPWRQMYPLPDGSIARADRYVAGRMYPAPISVGVSKRFVFDIESGRLYYRHHDIIVQL